MKERAGWLGVQKLMLISDARTNVLNITCSDFSLISEKSQQSKKHLLSTQCSRVTRKHLLSTQGGQVYRMQQE